jgi:hypothetical protein
MKPGTIALVSGISLIVCAVIAYPRIHAWLTDDDKVVVPGGRLAAEWRIIPKKPGDSQVDAERVFDKGSSAGAGANFRTDGSDDEVFRYFEAELGSQGWVAQPSSPSRHELQFCKQGTGAIVQINTGDPKTYYFGLVSENQRRSLNYCPAPSKAL